MTRTCAYNFLNAGHYSQTKLNRPADCNDNIIDTWNPTQMVAFQTGFGHEPMQDALLWWQRCCRYGRENSNIDGRLLYRQNIFNLVVQVCFGRPSQRWSGFHFKIRRAHRFGDSDAMRRAKFQY